jgi:hypothetical protein
MANHAAGGSAQLAVPCHMAGDPADNRSLDAALGIRTGHVSKRNRRCASGHQNPSHVLSPIVKNPQANAIRTHSVPTTAVIADAALRHRRTGDVGRNVTHRV